MTAYAGVDLVELRVFYLSADGEYRPGKGLAVRREQLVDLRKALQAAERAIRASPEAA